MQQIAQILDVRELRCPLPLLKAKRAISQLTQGECLKVLVTDPSSERDFKAWVSIAQHDLLDVKRVDGEFHYILRKG